MQALFIRVLFRVAFRWRHNLPYMTLLTKTNDNRQFGSFSTKSVCYTRSAPKIGGKYIEFDETFTVHHSRNFHQMTCRRRHGQRRKDSRMCSIEIFDNEHAVDNKLQSKRIAIGCRIYYCGHSVKK